MGTEKLPVPSNTPGWNFSPMPLIAPPLFGSDGAETLERVGALILDEERLTFIAYCKGRCGRMSVCPVYPSPLS